MIGYFMESKKTSISYWLFLNLGILLMAAGIYFFKAPNGFTTGGVSGLSIILAKLFPILSQATYMMAINIILLVVGVLVLGRVCGFLTIFCALMMSLENMLFEFFFPFIPDAAEAAALPAYRFPIVSETLTDIPLMELVYAVMLTGIGAAIIFRCKASSGGTDIVALILKKYTSMNVGTALLVSDLVIAASTFVVYGSAEKGLFALLGLFAKVFIVDDVLDSINMCKSFMIITTRPQEIDEYIMTELHHGATVYDAKGAYSGENKSIIITVCKRSEALRLRKKVKEIDPFSFIIITKTSEIMGKGFRDNVNN